MEEADSKEGGSAERRDALRSRGEVMREAMTVEREAGMRECSREWSGG